jgi:hypothetical protein
MSWFTHRTELGSGAPLGRGNGTGNPVTGTRIDAALAEKTLAGMPALSPSELPHSEQIHFTVRYALPEYVSFMWQHAGFLIRRRRIGRVASWWLLSKTTAASALHFVLQGRASHLYDFTIDEHGIIRASGKGVTLLPWADVSAIRRYGPGYMLVLTRGTLPIPFRCLDAAQAGAMDAFAVTLKAARR